jgi:hypothetical protein
LQAVGEWWKREKTAVKRRLDEATSWEQKLVQVRAKLRASVPITAANPAETTRESRVAVLDFVLANPERTVEVEVTKPAVEALMRELRAVDAEIRRCCDANS